jgi:hypothetical protein
MLTQKFLESYPNRQKYILKYTDKSWTTRKDTLTDKVLTNYWRDKNIFIGLRHGDTTNFFVLDIDTGSQYHPNQNKNAISKICVCLKKLNLPASNPIRSSDSGGIHIYYNLAKSFNSDEVASCIHNVLTEAGYVVKAGQLEIFPNVRKSVHSEFNGLRLPMQAGSTMLDLKTLQPIKSDMKQFQEFAEQCRISNAGFRILNTPKTVSKPSEDESSQTFFKRVSKRIKRKLAQICAPWQKQFKQDTKGIYTHFCCIIQHGFTGRGQTNEIVMCLTRQLHILAGVIDHTFVAKVIRNLKGFREFCGHQRDIEKRCKDAMQNLLQGDHYYPIRYPSTFAKYKQKVHELLRFKPVQKQSITEKLVDCAKQLLATNDQTLTTKTSWLQTLAKTAQTSMQTLYKYWGDVLKIYFERHLNKIRCNGSPSKDYNPIKYNTYLVGGLEEKNNLDQSTQDTEGTQSISTNTYDDWMFKTREEIENTPDPAQEPFWDDWDVEPKPTVSINTQVEKETLLGADPTFRKVLEETVGIERAMELRLLERIIGARAYDNLTPEPDEDEEEEEMYYDDPEVNKMREKWFAFNQPKVRFA